MRLCRPTKLSVPTASDRVRELSDHLLCTPTATEALHSWCEEHGISDGPIVAEKRNSGPDTFPGDDALDELRRNPHETVETRSVRLVRGAVAVSEAENWFIPERLPPPIRIALLATNLPFGSAIRSLRPSRRTFFVGFADTSRLKGISIGLPSSAVVLEHKAVVLDAERQPLAVVYERYLASLLLEAAP